jgi:hypothetical protein
MLFQLIAYVWQIIHLTSLDKTDLESRYVVSLSHLYAMQIPRTKKYNSYRGEILKIRNRMYILLFYSIKFPYVFKLN